MDAFKSKAAGKATVLTLLCLLALTVVAMADGAEADAEGDSDSAVVAKIGDTGYESLLAAVTAADDGDTITLVADSYGNGIGLYADPSDGEIGVKAITIDLGGFTYSIGDPLAGSSGTENQGFHFEKGSDVTIKNGTITSSVALMIIQNYGDLVLENVVVDGSGSASCNYTVSINNGKVTIGSGTVIKAAEGNYAFDACVTTHYADGAQITVEDGAEIYGNVQYDVWTAIPDPNLVTLNITGGAFDGSLVVETALSKQVGGHITVTGGTFADNTFNACVADGYAAYATVSGYTVASEGSETVEIGDVGYLTLADAIYAAESGDTVVLLADATMTSTLTVASDKSVTLDLAGYTLTNTADDVISNYGTLTVTDSGSAGKVVAAADGKGAFVNYPGATAILKGGTYHVSSEKGWYAIKNMGTMTIADGVTVTSNAVSKSEGGSNSSLVVNGWYGSTANDRGVYEPESADGAAHLTIDGGTFTSSSVTSATIKNDDWSVTVINGGTFTSNDGYVVQASGTCTINGGTFTGQNAIVTMYGAKGDTTKADPGALTVTGGTFSGTYLAESTPDKYDFGYGHITVTGGTFTLSAGVYDGSEDGIALLTSGSVITGGTFSVDMTGYIADGYVSVVVGDAFVVEAVSAAEGDVEIKGSEETPLPEFTGTDSVTVDIETSSGDSKGTAKVSFDSTAYDKVKGKTLNFVIGTNGLTDDQMTAVDGKTVVQISIKDVSGVDFGTGQATISVPYSGDIAGDSIVVYYVDKNGNLTACPTAYSDGIVTFSTSHFSVYMIGEKAVTPTPVFVPVTPTINVSGGYADLPVLDEAAETYTAVVHTRTDATGATTTYGTIAKTSDGVWTVSGIPTGSTVQVVVSLPETVPTDDTDDGDDGSDSDGSSAGSGNDDDDMVVLGAAVCCIVLVLIVAVAVFFRRN